MLYEFVVGDDAVDYGTDFVVLNEWMQTVKVRCVDGVE
jgi:hypothetical protein